MNFLESFFFSFLSFRNNNITILIYYFPSILFFIDQKNMKISLKLCAVSAVALMIGSTAMLHMILAGIGVGKDMIP